MHRAEWRSPGVDRLEEAARLAAPALWDFDPATGLLLTSAPLRRIYGVAADAPFGLGDFLAATHPDDAALWPGLFAGSLVLRPGQLVHYRIVRGPDAEVRWLTSEIETAYAAGVPVGFTGTVTDITEERRAADALVESEERLRLALEAGRMAVWEVDMATGRLTNSDELNLLLGLPADAHPTLADVRALYAPGELERLEREGYTYERVRDRSGGHPHSVRTDWTGLPSFNRTQIQVEFSIITPDGTPRQLLLRAQHAPSLDGADERVTGVLVDITDRKLAEDRLALVARELQHRVKNSLAIVQAIAAQTFRPGADLSTAMKTFSGRVRALSAATDAILQGGTAASMLEVAGRILEPYRAGAADPFRIEGGELPLPGRLATAVGMALHELCTNAVK